MSTIDAVKTGNDIDRKIGEIKKRLNSTETQEKREQYILGLIHGHNWFMETLQRGLKMDLSDEELKRFLQGEIIAQKIYWRSVRDRI
ncbi:MAG: hypothetical protein M0T81_00240 [Thermoplasmatales archaeon]|nr:hypothetical protein [Candidatus Thermoplasmatota archaeon]MDA8142395.1 hypothetical protein [Thermoplasmatales archaeon]